MKEELENYQKAVEENIAATKAETDARLRKMLARNNLHRARQAMWDREHELLNN